MAFATHSNTYSVGNYMYDAWFPPSRLIMWNEFHT